MKNLQLLLIILLKFNNCIRDNHESLFELTMQKVIENISPQNRSLIFRILEQIPKKENTKIYSYLIPLIESGIFQAKSFDLSNLRFETLPNSIAKNMGQLDGLDLSKNPRLKLEDSWCSYLYPNLKELSLNDCELSSDDIDLLGNFKALEVLRIAGNPKINFNSAKLKQILSKLKFLDVSRCRLKENSLITILQEAKELKTLIFSGNDLIDLNEQSIEEITNLLKERDSDTEKMSNKLNFGIYSTTNRLIFPKKSQLYSITRAHRGLCQLKHLDLSDCSITNEKFIEKLLNERGVESLILSNNPINFDYSEILHANSDSRILNLALKDCNITGEANLKALTSLKGLEILDISGNHFLGIRKNFELGCSKETLKKIKCSDSGMNRHGLKAFMNCPVVEKLDLSRNNFQNVDKSFIFGSSKETLIELDISSSSINHFVFHELCTFAKLQILNASNNNLADIEPSLRFGNLAKNAIILNLSNCGLTSIHLSFLDRAKSLKSLDLSKNNFINLHPTYNPDFSKHAIVELNLSESKIPIHSLSAFTSFQSLQRLDISGNKFQRPLPDIDLGLSHKSLIEVDASKTNLDAAYFLKFTSCPKLRTLDFSDNHLANISIGSSAKSLTSLSLQNCTLDDSCLPPIATCERLKALNLAGNERLFFNSSFMEKMLSLRDANFSNCMFTFRDLKNLKFMKNLKKLNLSESYLRRGDDKNLAPFDMPILLETLDLSHSISKIDVMTLISVGNCKSLIDLNLSGSSFGGDLKPYLKIGHASQTLRKLNLSEVKDDSNIDGLLMLFSNCTALEELNLKNNKNMSAPLVKHLEKSKNYIQSIDVSSCNLGIDDFNSLTDFPALKKVFFAFNRIQSKVKNAISLKSSKSSLEEIDLSHCNITYKMFGTLTDCPNLRVFRAEFDFFRDYSSILEFGISAKSLTSLYLPNSKLTSTDLKIILNLPKLKQLFLNGNGSIFDKHIKSSECAALKTLEKLDINMCKISDDFINSLSSFKALNTLIVSSKSIMTRDKCYMIEEKAKLVKRLLFGEILPL